MIQPSSYPPAARLASQPEPLTSHHYAQRRASLMAQLPANSVAIIPNAQEVTRSNDTEYLFRSNSDFAYLCGFPEPDAVLVMITPNEPSLDGDSALSDGESWLFVRPKDETREIWDGFRYGPDETQKVFGVDQAFELSVLDDKLMAALDQRDHLLFRLGDDASWDQRVIGWLSQLRAGEKRGFRAPLSVTDVKPFIHAQRLRKQAEELPLLRYAADVSAEGHRAAMACCEPGKNEYHLEAELLYRFAQAGARHAAYSTIVGGGKNACVLHYIENNRTLQDGDLVLIDAGCEFQGYAADITRTFPVNGTFSAPQKHLYQLVLSAQEATILAVNPGVTWPELMDIGVRILVDGLVRLGLLQGDVDALVQEKAYLPFFMHGMGHWLGLDVHDVGAYRGDDGEPLPFEPGMYLTIEPGLYIPADCDWVDEQWRGIGIRIEDNVLVTAQGHEVLTGAVPKSIAAIESLMAEARR